MTGVDGRGMVVDMLDPNGAALRRGPRGSSNSKVTLKSPESEQ